MAEEMRSIAMAAAESLSDDALLGMVLETSTKEILASMTPQDHQECEELRRRLQQLMEKYGVKK